MTLILGYVIDNYPVLVGDALTSTHASRPSSAVNLPSFEDVNGAIGERAAAWVCGMRQKVNILADNLIVAWSGSAIQASAALRDIRELNRRGPMRENAVLDLIQSFPENERDDLGLIGLHRGPAATTYFHFNAIQYQHQDFKHVIAAGSGSDSVSGLMTRYCPLPIDDSPILKIAHSALWIASQALGIEFLTGVNLLDNWGGAIEIASFNRGRAAKIDSVLFSFWRCDTRDDGSLGYFGMEPVFLKMEYQSDLLVLRTIRFENRATRDGRCRERINVVQPLLSAYGSDSKIYIDRPSMRHDFVCVCILLYENGKPKRAISHVQSGGLASPYRFSEHGVKIQIQMAKTMRRFVIGLAVRDLRPDLELRNICEREFQNEEEMLAHIASKRGQ